MEFYDDHPTNGFMSVMVAILYTLTIYLLGNLDLTILFNPAVRRLLSDYAYPVSISFLNASFATYGCQYADWNPFLGRVCTYTRPTQANTHFTSTSHSSVLSYRRPWMVDRLLESTSEVDLRGSSYRDASHVTVLLRSCTPWTQLRLVKQV